MYVFLVDLYRELLKSFYYVKPILPGIYISFPEGVGINSAVANATFLALVMYFPRPESLRESGVKEGE